MHGMLNYTYGIHRTMDRLAGWGRESDKVINGRERQVVREALGIGNWELEAPILG